jgi:hypothetical protein
MSSIFKKKVDINIQITSQRAETKLCPPVPFSGTSVYCLLALLPSSPRIRSTKNQKASSFGYMERRSGLVKY